MGTRTWRRTTAAGGSSRAAECGRGSPVAGVAGVVTDSCVGRLRWGRSGGRTRNSLAAVVGCGWSVVECGEGARHAARVAHCCSTRRSRRPVRYSTTHVAIQLHGPPWEPPTTRAPRSGRAGVDLVDPGANGPATNHRPRPPGSVRCRRQPERSQWGDRQLGAEWPAVPFDRFGLDRAEVADPAAAVLEGIGVERLQPGAPGR